MGAAILGIAALTLILSVGLYAQQQDIRISPPDAPAYVLREDAKMQSAARLGRLTLAAWGTTVLNAADTGHHNQIVYQRVLDTIALDRPSVLHGESARPFGAVAVVNMPTGFLVLWSDARPGAPGIYARAVDTAGRLIGSDWLLSADVRLLEEEAVWLTQEGGALRLTWGEARDSAVRYRSAALDGSWRPVGVAGEIAATNFDDTLHYDEFRGARIERESGGRSRFVHADGRIDVRPIADRFVYGAHYVNADTSVMTLETEGGKEWLVWYASLFDTMAVRKVRIVVPTSNGAGLKTLCRDTLGTISIVFDQAFGHSLGAGVSVVGVLIRARYSDDGQLLDTTYLAGVYGWTEMSTAAREVRGGLTLARVAFGDRNASLMRYDSFTNYYYKQEYRSEQSTASRTMLIDRSGDIVRFDPVVQGVTRATLRQRTPVLRLVDTAESVVKVLLPQTDVVLGVVLPTTPQNLAQTGPVLSLVPTELCMWRQANAYPTFAGARLASGHRDSVVQLFANYAPVRSLQVNNTKDRLLYSIVPEQRGDRCAIAYQYHQARYIQAGGIWQGDCRTSLIVRNDTAWMRTGELTGGVYGHTRLSLGYVTDSHSLVDVVQTVHGTIINIIDSAGSVTWRDTIPGVWPGDCIPVVQGRYLIVVGDSVFVHDKRIMIAKMSLVPTTPEIRLRARAMRLRGERFLRWYPAALDSSGAADGIVLEWYDLAGSLRATNRISAPMPAYRPFVYEAADRRLFIVWGADDGVHLIVADEGLRLVRSDTVISRWRGRARAPVCVVRNDTLIAAWEDYRNGASDIYGRALALAGLLAHSDGDDERVDVVPGPEGVTVSATAHRSGVYDVVIVDVQGREVWRDRVVLAEAGRFSVPVATSGFAVGAYFVSVAGEGERATGGFLVIR